MELLGHPLPYYRKEAFTLLVDAWLVADPRGLIEFINETDAVEFRRASEKEGNEYIWKAQLAWALSDQEGLLRHAQGNDSLLNGAVLAVMEKDNTSECVPWLVGEIGEEKMANIFL